MTVSPKPLRWSVRPKKKTSRGFVDNAPRNFSEKVDVRKKILGGIGGPARVFDAFAGSGKMYFGVWRDCEEYVGCDKKFFWDERTAYVADNMAVLGCLDLGMFNVFDLDAYGAPWSQAELIAHRRRLGPGERVGLAMTDGSGVSLAIDTVPLALARLCGISTTTEGAQRGREDLVLAALRRIGVLMGGRVLKIWQAERETGVRMLYLGVVYEGVGGDGAHGEAAA